MNIMGETKIEFRIRFKLRGKTPELIGVDLIQVENNF